jgi:general secretion pathway protein H
MSNADARAGFTLIEMMAVMMIVALVASLVIAMVPGTGRAGLKAVVMNTVALLRRERLGAILTSSERHVSLDGERRVLVGDGGDTVAIPSDVMVDVLGANALWAGRLAVASFHPDGASSGAAIKFSREGVEYEVRVNWYTGGVAIETH